MNKIKEFLKEVLAPKVTYYYNDKKVNQFPKEVESARKAVNDFIVSMEKMIKEMEGR